ncbi:MAG TPA: serine/threonine-protein kinase [Pyrinomonadaceae bacterium]|jgi:WD40 repeat protein
MLTPNSLLAGRYRIVRAVGRGGQGTVYEAVDERLKRVVAVKEVHAGEEVMREALASEARLLAGLDKHPSLPTVFDYFSSGESQHLVMEYVPGETLGELLKARDRPFPVPQVVAWAEDLLSALVFLHSRTPPIIHRDIKPHNLKPNGRGGVILLDFGLAKDQAAGSVVAGYTLAYAPPEQLQGLPTDARSDLYALAASLYQLCTNVRPADALTRLAALGKGLPDPLRAARELNPEAPPGFSAALAWALSLERGRRPASAAEFLKSLRAAPSAPDARDESEVTAVRGRDLQGGRPAEAVQTKYGILGRADGYVLSVAFSPDGGLVAAGSWDTTIRLWNTATGEMRILGRCDGPVASVAFSPDGRLFASASSDVRLWDLQSGEVIRRLNQFSFCVKFSPDGSRLAWSSKAPTAGEGAVCVWDMDEEQPTVLGLCRRWVRSLDFSPDNRSIVTASWDGPDSVRLWDVAARQSAPLQCCPEGADSVAFSHCGNYVAAAGKLITLLDLGGGGARAIGAHGDGLSSVAFSPDDKYIASAGKAVCLWDSRSGQKYTLEACDERINTVAYSPDGESVAAGGNDNTVRRLPARRPGS